MACDLTRCADAATRVKKLVPEITSCVGIPFWIESDQGTHYMAEVNPLLAKTMGYS